MTNVLTKKIHLLYGMQIRVEGLYSVIQAATYISQSKIIFGVPLFGFFPRVQFFRSITSK